MVLWNGRIEQTVVTMLTVAGLDRQYWGVALLTACYVQNRLPTSYTGQTPFDHWFGRTPNLAHLWVWGCVAYALKPEKDQQKMGPKADKVQFLGYQPDTKGCQFWYEQREAVLVHQDAVFVENRFILKSNMAEVPLFQKREHVAEEEELVQEQNGVDRGRQQEQREVAEKPVVTTKSGRVSRQPDRYTPGTVGEASKMLTEEDDILFNRAIHDPMFHYLFHMQAAMPEPQTVEEAF